MSTGYNLLCPCPCKSGLNIQSWSLLLDSWLNASKLCLCVCCSCILFRIIIFLLRVTVVTSRKYLETLQWRTRWWSSRPRCLGSLSLLADPLATNLLVRGIILLALGRFDISLCARVSSFFSLANCWSKPSDLSGRPLRLPNGALLLVSGWASIARSRRRPSSNKRPSGAPLILQKFSRHVENISWDLTWAQHLQGMDLKALRAQIQSHSA